MASNAAAAQSASVARGGSVAMTTFDDLPTAIQDRIHTDVALMIMVEEEQKAYILRCCTLRRQPFIEGWLNTADFSERAVTAGERAAYQLSNTHPFLSAEARHNTKYNQLKDLARAAAQAVKTQ